MKRLQGIILGLTMGILLPMAAWGQVNLNAVTDGLDSTTGLSFGDVRLTVDAHATAANANFTELHGLLRGKAWSSASVSYTAGDVVSYIGSIYVAADSHTSTDANGPGDPTHWTEASGGSGISHAPSDDGYYASRNGAWTVIDSMLMTLPTADNQMPQATGAGTWGWTSSIEGLIDDTAGLGDSSSILSADEIMTRLADYLLSADAPAATSTFTNKTIDAEGTGNLITAPVTVWFAAAGCNNATAAPFLDLPTSNAAAAACITGTNTQKGALDFDAATDESGQVAMMLPSDWTGTIDLAYKWLAAATSGSVVWAAQTSCVAGGETDDPSWNTASTVTDAAMATTLQTNDAAISSVTATGCAAGELLHLRISRDADNASDTMTGDARLLGVQIKLRRSM